MHEKKIIIVFASRLQKVHHNHTIDNSRFQINIHVYYNFEDRQHTHMHYQIQIKFHTTLNYMQNDTLDPLSPVILYQRVVNRFFSILHCFLLQFFYFIIQSRFTPIDQLRVVYYYLF